MLPNSWAAGRTLRPADRTFPHASIRKVRLRRCAVRSSSEIASRPRTTSAKTACARTCAPRVPVPTLHPPFLHPVAPFHLYSPPCLLNPSPHAPHTPLDSAASPYPPNALLQPHATPTRPRYLHPHPPAPNTRPVTPNPHPIASHPTTLASQHAPPPLTHPRTITVTSPSRTAPVPCSQLRVSHGRPDAAP